MLPKEPQLSIVLDALGDDAKIQVLPQVNDRGRNRSIVGIFGHLSANCAKRVRG